MKHSKKNSINTDTTDFAIINTALLLFAGIFLSIAIVSYSAMNSSSQSKHIKKTKLKESKSKTNDTHPHSNVSLLGKKQSGSLLTETEIDISKHINVIEEINITTADNVDEEVTEETINLVIDFLESELAVDTKISEEPVEEYISVAEEFLASLPETNLEVVEESVQTIEEPAEEWDTSVDLRFIYGSDAYVPRFISSSAPKTCNHNNGSTESDPWLIRHQEIDGHWDTGQHEGAGTHDIDCAATAAALLALLARGYTDRCGKHKNNVKRGIEWLIAQQLINGSWDKSNYVNAICTMCLAEATAMGCGGLLLKEKTELAVSFLLNQQNISGCFDYSGPSKIDNMTVTGWCILALKSAQMANIKESEIKEVFLKCNDFLNTIEGTNDNTIKSKGLAWYMPGVLGTGNPGGGCQAVAMLIRQYIGWNRSAPWLVAAAEGQSINLPENMESLDIHKLYFASFALFQQGGQPWKKWHSHISEITKKAQRTDEDFKGSWDNNGSCTDIGGRVLNTALISISLIEYYCYSRDSVFK